MLGIPVQEALGRPLVSFNPMAGLPRVLQQREIELENVISDNGRRDSITDVPGIRVGHAQNEDALTGCTVVLCEVGAIAGVEVRGSAPGTRETDLLSPTNLVEQVHAVCLSGGSAFGLDAASGVMRYLEERGHGLPVGVCKVPIVPAAVLFDLAIGSATVRPDADMGFAAAANASHRPVEEGNVGAGCGATVGKLAGMSHAMKGGLGSAAYTLPTGLVIGAIVAVNAVGAVVERATNRVIAGMRGEGDVLLNPLDVLSQWSPANVLPGTNTTIGVIATNAKLTKSEATKVAQMAHDGLARCIYPIHTMHDGDTIFALSTGTVGASVDVVGTFAAHVLETAVIRAIQAATAAGGLPAWCDFNER